MRSKKTPFKGRQIMAAVIPWAVRWCLQFPLNYYDLERMLDDRGLGGWTRRR